MSKPPVATALLLGWKRPENLERLIASLRRQTVEVKVFLWLNDGDDQRYYDADLRISASVNLMCWPRWFMANYATSDYVVAIDDDVDLADDRVIEDCVDYAKKHDCAVGGYGVRLRSGNHYWQSSHVSADMPGCANVPVDIIKGRFLLVDRSQLQGLPMMAPNSPESLHPRVEDDIIVSSRIDKKVIPDVLRGRLVSLPEGDVGLCRLPAHKLSRMAATFDCFR